MKQYRYGKQLQDGKIFPGDGRIIIFENRIIHTNSHVTDHPTLISALAARDGLDKSAVMSSSARFYFRREGNIIWISPVRKLDDELFFAHRDLYTRLITGTVK